MGVATGILVGVLVVIGRAQQVGRPCGEPALFVVDAAVAVRIGEPVGVGVRIVEDRRADDIDRIRLDGRIESVAHGVDLAVDAFGRVAVAVVVDIGHADGAQALE